MAKNKKRDGFQIDASNKGAAAIVTANRNKRGEIRGKTRKETKNIKAMCTHHVYGKKGKKHMTLISEQNGMKTCTCCGESFPSRLLKKEELKKIVGDMKMAVNQTKFFVEAADLGKDTEKYLGRMSIDLAHFKKTYKRVGKSLLRSEHIKNKKKKNKRNNVSSNQYGSWRSV